VIFMVFGSFLLIFISLPCNFKAKRVTEKIVARFDLKPERVIERNTDLNASNRRNDSYGGLRRK